LNLFNHGIWADFKEWAQSSGNSHLLHLADVLKHPMVNPFVKTIIEGAKRENAM